MALLMSHITFKTSFQWNEKMDPFTFKDTDSAICIIYMTALILMVFYISLVGKML